MAEEGFTEACQPAVAGSEIKDTSLHASDEAPAAVDHVAEAEQHDTDVIEQLVHEDVHDEQCHREDAVHESAASDEPVSSESCVESHLLSAMNAVHSMDGVEGTTDNMSVEEKSVSSDEYNAESHVSSGLTVAESESMPQEGDCAPDDGRHVRSSICKEAELVIPVRTAEAVVEDAAVDDAAAEDTHASGAEHVPATSSSQCDLAVAEVAPDDAAEVIAEVIHHSLHTHRTGPPAAGEATAVDCLRECEAVEPHVVPAATEALTETESEFEVDTKAEADGVADAPSAEGEASSVVLAVQPVVPPPAAAAVSEVAFSAAVSATSVSAVPTRRVHHPRPAVKGSVVAWKGLTYSSYDDSEDEFELSTCRCPVYQPNENESGSCCFKNGAPAMAGEVTSCFEEPNLLYRIVNAQNKTWAFYNDSRTYEMHIQFTFGKHSSLQALDSTAMTHNADGRWCASVVVYPTETQRFVKGRVNGFTSKLRALPLSDEYHDTCRRQNEEDVAQQLAAIRRVCDSASSEEVLRACLAHNLPFIDVEFPPCQASLDRGAAKPFRPLAWSRPRDYLPEELADQVRLFRGDIAPGRVEPGELGDSWLLCAMACVSENQDWLRNLFRHPSGKVLAQREHALGAYRVSFNKHGVWHGVIVDDYLPVSAGVPKYARSADDPAEIWPCILQKALAKLYGSYAGIGTGDPLHALTDMTGFAHFRFDEAMLSVRRVYEAGATEASPAAEVATSADLAGHTLRSTVLRALGAGYTVMMSTPTMHQALHGTPSARRGGQREERGAGGGAAVALGESEIVEKYRSVGLVMGHAYTILDAKEFAEHRVCLLRVRTMWGRGVDWRGPWHRGDARWQRCPDVAEACEVTVSTDSHGDGAVEEDGTFWMTWESAMAYFNGGGICYGQPFVYDYRVPGVFDRAIPSVMFELHVTTSAWMTLVLSQKDTRFMARAHGGETNTSEAGSRLTLEEEEHAPLMLSICTPSEQESTMRVAMNSTVHCELPSEDRWTFLQAREVSIVRRFDPGRYLVLPRTMALNGQAATVPFTLGLITDQEIGENGAATVQCVRLPASSSVFENFAEFENEIVPCEPMTYQKRLLNGCVQSMVSSNGLQ